MFPGDSCTNSVSWGHFHMLDHTEYIYLVMSNNFLLNFGCHAKKNVDKNQLSGKNMYIGKKKCFRGKISDNVSDKNILPRKNMYIGKKKVFPVGKVEYCFIEK